MDDQSLFKFSLDHIESPEVLRVIEAVYAENQSPYAAWCRVLNIPLGQLPHYLDMPGVRVRPYERSNKVSPDLAHVKYFCGKMGIHPALLQPSLKLDQSVYFYHPVQLHAICDVLTSPYASEQDAALSVLALQSERRKFLRFHDTNFHLIEIMNEAIKEKSQATLLGKDFKTASCDFLENIGEALLRHRQSMQEKYDKNWETVFEDTGKVKNLRKNLIQLGGFSEMSTDEQFDNFSRSVAKDLRLGEVLSEDFLRVKLQTLVRNCQTDPIALQGFYRIFMKYLEAKKTLDALILEQKTGERMISQYDRLVDIPQMTPLAIPLFKNDRIAQAHIKAYGHTMLDMGLSPGPSILSQILR